MPDDPSTRPDCPGYFEAMFDKSDDPWQYKSRWYEQRKRALTLACLPSKRYQIGYEPGCANGELSAALATRCDRLIASDGVPRILALARERLKAFPHVEVREAWAPGEWPEEKFDLIVLSEFLFYLRPEDVDQIARLAQASLLAGGAILACHWRHPIAHCVMTGDTAHEALQRMIHLPNHCHIIEPDLRLDVWSAAPTAAELDGLV